MQARLEDDAQCLLVIIGATPEGKKELVGLIDGVRESTQSWRELLLDLKRRGLAMGPELAVADGALGFWKAIEEVWSRTRGQRCWVHKTANVLNKLPKSQQSKAKRALQDIWMAETRSDADNAFDTFIETYAVKYEKAAACLAKDRETLLAFYDFPAEHWKHLRTTNPIESTFATVRHRTVRSKGCLSNKTALAMVFKLTQGAQNSWRRLDGHNQLPKLRCKVHRRQPSGDNRPPPDPYRHQDSAIAHVARPGRSAEEREQILRCARRPALRRCPMAERGNAHFDAATWSGRSDPGPISRSDQFGAILREHPQFPAPSPELQVATAPCQTWSMGIGSDAVLPLRREDIFSRYAVGWMVCRPGEGAGRFPSEIAAKTSRRPAPGPPGVGLVWQT